MAGHCPPLGLVFARKLRLYKAVAKSRLKRRANEAKFQEGLEQQRLEELEQERREREHAERVAAAKAARAEREAREAKEREEEEKRKAGITGKLRASGRGALARMYRTMGKVQLEPIRENNPHASRPTDKGDDDTASTATFSIEGVHGEDHDRVVRQGAVAHGVVNRFGSHFQKKLHLDAINIRRSAKNDDKQQDYWRRSMGGHNLPKHAMPGKKKQTLLAHFHPNRAERYRPSMALQPFNKSK